MPLTTGGGSDRGHGRHSRTVVQDRACFPDCSASAHSACANVSRGRVSVRPPHNQRRESSQHAGPRSVTYVISIANPRGAGELT